ncbi:MAG: AAA family ATPase [Amphiplicatus sp.]
MRKQKFFDELGAELDAHNELVSGPPQTYSRSYLGSRNEWGREPEYALWPLMPIADICSIAAASGTGKTTLKANLAVRIMVGAREQVLKAPKAGSVIFLLPEAPQVFFKAIDGAAHAIGLTDRDLEERCIPILWADLCDWPSPEKPAYAEKLKAEIARANSERPLPVRAVFIDSTFLGLPDSENESRVATPVMRQQLDIAQGCKVAICNALHMDKGGNDSRGSQVWHDRSAVFGTLKKVGDTGRDLAHGVKHKLKHRYWPEFEKKGLCYGYREENGLPFLHSFDFSKWPKGSKDTEKPANGPVRSNAIAAKANAYYREAGVNSVTLDDLWSDAKTKRWSKAKTLHDEQEARIIANMSELGWTYEGDTFSR